MEIHIGTVLIIIVGVLFLGGVLTLRWLSRLIRSFFFHSVSSSNRGGNNGRKSVFFPMVLAIVLTISFFNKWIDTPTSTSAPSLDDFRDETVRVSHQLQPAPKSSKWPMIYVGFKSSGKNRNYVTSDDSSFRRASYDKRQDRLKKVCGELEQELLSSNNWNRKTEEQKAANTDFGLIKSTRSDFEKESVHHYRQYHKYQEADRERAFYFIQVAAGSIPEFVRSEARKLKELFPHTKVQLYEDPKSDWIKIFVGEFTSENESLNYKRKLEKHLKQKCQIVDYIEIDEHFLSEFK